MKSFLFAMVSIAMILGLSCHSYAAEPPEINTAALADLVEQAGSLGDTGYTKDSWEALQGSLVSARTLLENPSNQDIVDDMTFELHTTVEKLSLDSFDFYEPAGASKFRTGDISSFLTPFEGTYLANGLVVLPQALGIFGIVLGIRLVPRVMRKIVK